MNYYDMDDEGIPAMVAFGYGSDGDELRGGLLKISHEFGDTSDHNTTLTLYAKGFEQDMANLTYRPCYLFSQHDYHLAKSKEVGFWEGLIGIRLELRQSLLKEAQQRDPDDVFQTQVFLASAIAKGKHLVFPEGQEDWYKDNIEQSIRGARVQRKIERGTIYTNDSSRSSDQHGYKDY